jgi:hypothetical protein
MGRAVDFEGEELIYGDQHGLGMERGGATRRTVNDTPGSQT